MASAHGLPTATSTPQKKLRRNRFHRQLDQTAVSFCFGMKDTRQRDQRPRQPRAPPCFQVLHVIAMSMEKGGRWRKDRQKMGMSMAAMRPHHSPTQPGLGKDDKGSFRQARVSNGDEDGAELAPKGPRKPGSETVVGAKNTDLATSLFFSSVKDLILHLGDHGRSQDSFSERVSREEVGKNFGKDGTTLASKVGEPNPRLHYSRAEDRKEPSRTALIGITQEYLHEDSMCHDIMTACYPTHRLLSLGPMGP
ncbi:hypothetical protein GE21DRAFT_1350098 [Neurospora crassa]|nr:hypothetical protein GE21DRAFT_1350098 [Neurospora crassa]